MLISTVAGNADALAASDLVSPIGISKIESSIQNTKSSKDGVFQDLSNLSEDDLPGFSSKEDGQRNHGDYRKPRNLILPTFSDDEGDFHSVDPTMLILQNGLPNLSDGDVAFAREKSIGLDRHGYGGADFQDELPSFSNDESLSSKVKVTTSKKKLKRNRAKINVNEPPPISLEDADAIRKNASPAKLPVGISSSTKGEHQFQ
jgi:hypothetical protein